LTFDERDPTLGRTSVAKTAAFAEDICFDVLSQGVADDGVYGYRVIRSGASMGGM